MVEAVWNFIFIFSFGSTCKWNIEAVFASNLSLSRLSISWNTSAHLLLVTSLVSLPSHVRAKTPGRLCTIVNHAKISPSKVRTSLIGRQPSTRCTFRNRLGTRRMWWKDDKLLKNIQNPLMSVFSSLSRKFESLPQPRVNASVSRGRFFLGRTNCSGVLLFAWYLVEFRLPLRPIKKKPEQEKKLAINFIFDAKSECWRHGSHRQCRFIVQLGVDHY